MHRTRLRVGLSALAIIALTATGCSDDSDSNIAAYCDAVLAMESAPEIDIDFDTATPEQQAEALRAYRETFQPLMADAMAVVPDEIADHAEVVARAVEEMMETGDPSVTEQPGVAAADGRLDAFDRENCRAR
jgi:hypothetical protein